MQAVIREYLRDEAQFDEAGNVVSRGNPFGVMMASLKEGKLAFGFSQCHERDNFDKKLGNTIASNRLEQFDPTVEEVLIVPADMVEMMERFVERA